LRQRGVRATLADEVDAAGALEIVDLFDMDEVGRALRVTFKVRPGDVAAFEDAFAEAFLDRPSLQPPRRPRPERARAVTARSPAGAVARAASAPEPARSAPGAGVPDYSPEALLRSKPFEALSERELAAMDRVLRRLVVRLARERSRRLVPERGRGLVDLRRSLRGSVGTRGELLRLARRARAVEEPRLVLLCDTSGSMETHTRFLLTFAVALRRAARRVEVFAFNTALTRLTPWLQPGKPALTLARVAGGVPDWAGGTRIGECLEEFVRQYAARCIGPRTVVVIVSDGLDRGEPDALIRAMHVIKSRARRVIWLNPLLGDPRYQPTARGMAAALPFVDRLAPAHNLESLERLASMVTA
jgi:uncharacterized protein with von Willebrand factor type A (vWA) domain